MGGKYHFYPRWDIVKSNFFVILSMECNSFNWHFLALYLPRRAGRLLA